MSDYHCDQVDRLRDIDNKLTELRAIMFGPNGSGDGFIRSTVETLEIVRVAVNGFATQVPLLQAATTALTAQMTEMSAQVSKLFVRPRIRIREIVPIVVSIVSTAGLIAVAAIYASKGLAP